MSAAASFRLRFTALANGMACRYGAPIWLVGSALTSDEPGDYDIRVILGEEDYARLFGRDDERTEALGFWSPADWRRGREQLKQSRRLSRSMGCNIDFQFQRPAKSTAQYHGKELLRLDSAPAWLDTVGEGEA